MRLTDQARAMGLIDDARWDAFNRKRDAVALEIERLKSTWVHPKNLSIDAAERVLGKQIEREYSLHDLLKRPNVQYETLESLRDNEGKSLAGELVKETQIFEQVEIQIKYAGYVNRQQEEVKKQAELDDQIIPEELNYDHIQSLSIEVKQKLKQSRPQTIGQARRVSGVTPAAMSLLLIHIKRLQYGRNVA
jgi:tRNA uridine 5-carboxymethylaminomethyl modification enzyme